MTDKDPVPPMPSLDWLPTRNMTRECLVQMQDYGDARAAHARRVALEEVAEYVDRNLMSCGEYADVIRRMK